MAEVGGTTGEQLDQPACSKQAAQDLVQSHPSISKDGLHDLSGQPVPVDHPRSKGKLFRRFKWNLLQFCLCSFLVSSLGTTKCLVNLYFTVLGGHGAACCQ